MSNKIWFTSDTHFGGERTLILSKRPFKSVKEMDKTIIDNWNKVIDKDDIVYHLGDFGDYEYIKKLNGKIILIYGNYEEFDATKYPSIDDFKKYLKSLGFMEQHYQKIINLELNGLNKILYLAHKPLDFKQFFPESEGEFSANCLFGHVHKLSMIKKMGLNVGQDCHNFTPIDLDTVLFYLNAIEKYYDENVFL